ncbi:MAG: UDP-N-acetylmuramate dehydrogenase [Puniceicoccales bacterium]|jgi:UDP-N-acetylmuramate dehydrogenase|nr:UDP-N-acetylmuramate dehydrogenase [Puniceicoccales bacterium]
MDQFRQGSKKFFLEAIDRRFREDRFLKKIHKFLPHYALAENVPMARFTSLRIGGPARFFAEPHSLEELRRLLRCAREAELRVFVLGAGTNLLVDDGGFFGLVLRLRGAFWERYYFRSEGITARCGLSLRCLGRLCGENAIGGYEFCNGIPGTVGGAIFQNAGAFGSAIGDLIREVAILQPDGEFARLRPAFSYRRSFLPAGAIVLSVELLRQEGDKDHIFRRQKEMAKMRRERQPREPSAGSLFRNPPSHSAGELIERAGLKGFRVGGAQISRKHGNFAVNAGGATCADVLNLTFFVKHTVRERFKIDLEPEVYYLANSPEESP